MKHTQLAAILSVSALALFGCQSPASSTSSNTQVKPAATTTTTTNTHVVTKTVRTLPSVACNNQSVNLDLNQGTVVQQGTLKGYEFCEYNIPVKAGQHLNVMLDTPSTSVYAVAYGHDELSDIALTTDGFTATTDEVLQVRVKLTRNAARQQTQVPFKVQFSF